MSDAEGIKESDYWKWYNDHLQKSYSAVAKSYLVFVFLALLSIALGFNWIVIDKFGQLGADIKFTQTGRIFLLVICGLGTVGAFLNLLSELLRVLLLQPANDSNPYVLITLAQGRNDKRIVNFLNRYLNYISVATVGFGALAAVVLLVLALIAVVVGLF